MKTAWRHLRGSMWTGATAAAALLLCAAAPGAARAAVEPTQQAVPSFYKRPEVFVFRPNEKKAGQTVARFGPVGIGIELTLPAFGMKISNVEKGSPADRTGKLKKGQILETINGQRLADIDPRIQLGDLITEAEAADGVVRLVVRDQAGTPPREVVVRIPALGAYRPTWPLNCAKSDRIVRALAASVRGRDYPGITLDAGQAMLFLLSTGEDKDLAVVRDWVHRIAEKHKADKQITVNNWVLGRCGMALGEYYLRTGDAAAIPTIEKLADCARWGMYNDGWAHGTYQGHLDDRTKARMAFPYMWGGHINTCGVHIPTFLMLARACGAQVDEHTLQASLRHFFRYAGRGNVAYGDHLPEKSFGDNGKTGALAFTMAAAADLTPDGEQSIYARARDISAVKGFYSTSWMLIGHTGGGVGEIWRSASMGLMYDRQPKKYREFMDNRRWFYELSRRYDGSFGIIGGGRYDNESWGVMMGLSYTVPRKTLQLTGAPRSRFAKSYPLPARPWGDAADDVFCSFVPARGEQGETYEAALAAETFADGSSRAAFAAMSDPAVSDAVLMKYAHHPDQGIRRGAASFICHHGRDHLIPVLLGSKDPRARHAGAMAIYGTFKRKPLPAERVTDEMVAGLGKMIEDPNEAWWGAENAMQALALARPEQIAPHLDRLLYFLGHEEWWLSAAAMSPLSKIAGDERYDQRILSGVAKVVATDTHLARVNAAKQLIGGLKNASPKVQSYALRVLCRAYRAFPDAAALHGPDEISMAPAETAVLNEIVRNAGQLKGGYDAIFDIARQRFPDEVLPHSRVYLKQKASQLSPEVQRAIEQFKATQPSGE